MTSFKQIEANRRNARLSTGPVTDGGKRRSRQNAVRHGLTAETVIEALEDAEDYAAFEMAITADYDAQTDGRAGIGSKTSKPIMAVASRHHDRKWPVQDPGKAIASIPATATGLSRSSEDYRQHVP